MSDTSHESSFGYRAKRFPMTIDVSIDDGELRWSYRMFGNEWRERLPLAAMRPHPTTMIDGSNWQADAVSLILAPILIGVAFYLLGVTAISVVIAVAVVTLTIAMLVGLRVRGPIEWVVFDTILGSKTIYFFRGKEQDDFDGFVERLNGAVLASYPSDER